MKTLLVIIFCFSFLYANEFIINGIKIQKGTKKTINIELPKLYNTPTKLPIRVIRGKEDGPTIFISAAIHGDELNGIEIIRRFRNLKILNKLRGNIILVPIVNIYGVMNLSRYLPDRRDLNRYFPGTSEGSLTSRIAKIFFDEIVLKCDLGIDLHTASIHKSNLPQIRTNIDDENTFRLAKAFEAPVVLHSELRDGSLRSVAQEKGVPILLYEAGEALRFDEQSIKIGVKGIVNVLRANEMLPKSSKTGKRKIIPLVARNSSWLRATQSGILRTLKDLGDTVKEGETIAYINEPLDDQNIYKLTAPYDGVIIGKTKIPLIQEGDAVFHIANTNQLKVANKKILYFCEDAIEDCEYININQEDIK